MRHKLLCISFYFVLVLFVTKVVSKGCPRPSVKKRTIIQSTASIKNGALLISKDIVESARECYSLCCNDLTCNVAVMHYKEIRIDEVERVEKYCFLFSCGSPSVCTYEFHDRYAVIDLGPREDGRSSIKKEEKTSVLTTYPTTSAATTTTTTIASSTLSSTTTTTPETTTIAPAKSLYSLPSSVKVPSSSIVTTSIIKDAINECLGGCPFNYDPVCGDDDKTYDNECLFKLAKCKRPHLKMASNEACRECPPGVPMAMCSDDPCKIIPCPANKDAVCKANFCGGCNAVYYDRDGVKVNCSNSGVTIYPHHNEQSVTVGNEDYEEAPVESFVPAKSVVLPAKVEKDPYYNAEKRKWLVLKNKTESGTHVPVVVVVKEAPVNSLMSLPLLVALIICIILLIGVIYRVKCVTRGRAKKVPVDDGDYLINGMYL